MAIASLVISIFALLTAGASALYARQQAEANKKLVDIEQQRNLEQQTPEFSAWVEDLGGWQRLWLRLESPRPLDQLSVKLIEADGISFTHSQNGVDPAAEAPIKQATWDTLDHGGKACWRIAIDDDRPNEARLHIRCRRASDTGEGAEWTVVVPFELPPRGPWVL